MKSSKIGPFKFPKWLFTIFAFWALLTILAMACDVPSLGGDKSLMETQAALGVQSTFDSERAATLNAQQTSIATQSTLAASPTPQGSTGEDQQATMSVQQTTIAQQATQLAQKTAAPLPTEAPGQTDATATPVPQQQGQSTPLILTDWKLFFFNRSSAGCYLEGQDCWVAYDNWTKDRNWGELDMTMTTRDSIYIDPNWPNPYLVFWHIYDTHYTLDVLAIVDSKREILWHFVGNTGNWSLVAAKLEKYKGQSIAIKFNAAGGPSKNSPRTEWSVQDIKIIPNYQP